MLVMSLSLALLLSGYQEPAYPGTNTTWQIAEQRATMGI